MRGRFSVGMGNVLSDEEDGDVIDPEERAYAFMKAVADKPLDASDMATLEDAKREILRLRQAALLYDQQSTAARRLQAAARMRRESKAFAGKKEAAVKVQSIKRSHDTRKELKKQASAASMLQAQVRGKRIRKLKSEGRLDEIRAEIEGGGIEKEEDSSA